MSIAQQTATPAGLIRQRHALVEVASPLRGRGWTLTKIGGLIFATSVGAALLVTAAAVGLIMMATSLVH